MLASVKIAGLNFRVNLSKPLDISIPLDCKTGPRAWFVNPVSVDPVRNETFTGSVKEGGSVNFNTIGFNPHGNGTHTECLGHITPKVHSVNKALKSFFSIARLISIRPVKGFNDKDFSTEQDTLIGLKNILTALGGDIPEAILIRTLPNTKDKLKKNWSDVQWPQLDEKAMVWMAENNVKHLLIDLPSVDRKEDGGKLLSHHAFWQVPEKPRMDATITEMIFIPDSIDDGTYLLELQLAPFENDASPSRPVLYEIEK